MAKLWEKSHWHVVLPCGAVLTVVANNSIVSLLCPFWCAWAWLCFQPVNFLFVPNCSEDARSCRFPTADDIGYKDGFCAVHAPSLVATSMPAKKFQTDCDAQAKTGWNDTLVSFAQIFDASQLDVSPGDASNGADTAFDHQLITTVHLLPSHQFVFFDEARKRAHIESDTDTLIFPPHEYNSIVDSVTPCAPQNGSMLEAINHYISACEANYNMRESAWLIVWMLIFNTLELFLLLKV